MSTRSGKRIHACEDSPDVDTDNILHNERKMRSRKQKENVERIEKKKDNYVSFPAEEGSERVFTGIPVAHVKVRKAGKAHRNTLKEHNVDVSDDLESNSKTVRKARRGKTLLEESDHTDTIRIIQNHEKSETTTNDRKRNRKKKNHKKNYIEPDVIQDVKSHVIKEKSVKIDKLSPNDMGKQKAACTDIGTDNISVDSFHSAAGSPTNMKLIENDYHLDMAGSFIVHKTKDNILTTDINLTDASITSKTKMDLSIRKKRKSSTKNTSFDKVEVKHFNEVNRRSTFDKSPNITADSITMEFEKKKKRKISTKNSTIHNIESKHTNGNTLNTTFDKTEDVPTPIDIAADVSSRKRKKSSIIKSAIDNVETNDLNNGGNLNTTFDKVADTSNSYVTIDVSTRKRRKSSINNSTFDKIEINKRKSVDDIFNSTGHTVDDSGVANCNLTKNIDQHGASGKLNALKEANKTNDYYDNISNSTVNNSTFEREEKIGMSSVFNKLNVANVTFDKDNTDSSFSSFGDKSLQTNKSPQKNNRRNESEIILLPHTMDSTSEGDAKSKNLDSTFDKETDLNTTFDTEKKSDSKKSSFINSDATVNVTYDKSGDNSRISITSDESKTENILNHTPVLIESSIDESSISKERTPEKSDIPRTPLKREGTFTKEVPDLVMSPRLKTSPDKTPVKRKSSPGSTPFPYSKSSQKEKVKLNVTRSIEKSLRRSSLVEVEPRQTRVMFCSPVNNPAIASQMKGRVIKSNLKGSNKSFVFDDSVSSEGRASRRKRSLTVGTVGEAESRVKRKRLAAELQHSVDRLSRPRTQSATAKLPDPGTPSKKFGTPSKAKPESRVSRTKLPNFAALHQKQFAKMESLDECQERKAKRAKQLLTPNGCVGLLERISPKGTPPSTAPPVKEPAAKQHTPSKPKLPTLESLNPGYTRFGFKLNTDVNPFGVGKKTEAKSEPRPNGLSRKTTCLTLPSLAGTTAGRREAAKQAVMREKSFSEKRDVKRKETRTVIKGVRTNRRFELQMKLRNINA